MDDVLAAYFSAWNEQDADQRARLRRRSVTDEVMFHGALPSAD